MCSYCTADLLLCVHAKAGVFFCDAAHLEIKVHIFFNLTSLAKDGQFVQNFVELY